MSSIIAWFPVIVVATMSIYTCITAWFRPSGRIMNIVNAILVPVLTLVLSYVIDWYNTVPYWIWPVLVLLAVAATALSIYRAFVPKEDHHDDYVDKEKHTNKGIFGSRKKSKTEEAEAVAAEPAAEEPQDELYDDTPIAPEAAAASEPATDYISATEPQYETVPEYAPLADSGYEQAPAQQVQPVNYADPVEPVQPLQSPDPVVPVRPVEPSSYDEGQQPTYQTEYEPTDDTEQYLKDRGSNRISRYE